MPIKRVDVLIFLGVSSFAFINSFFLHKVDFIDSTIFFIISVSSAAVVFLYRQKGASLLKLYFLFSYLFFGFLPSIELYYNTIYWGGREFSSVDYAVAGLLVLLFNGVVLLVYVFFNKSMFLSSTNDVKVDHGQRVSLTCFQVLLLMLTSLSSFFLVLYMNDFNILSLVLRGGELVERKSLDSVYTSLLYGFFVRFIPISTAIVLLFTVRGGRWLKVFFLIIGIISAFPTGLARLSVPTYYFPLMLFFFPLLIKNNRVPLLTFLGVIFVFPFLEGFRKFSAETDLSYSLDYNFLLAGHFDAFQNFARIVSMDFVTYGYQLLGSLFFYIPRYFWHDKPVGTGHMLAEEAGYTFQNISATWYAEGWANFGFLGALLFSVVIGFAMARLDRKYWLGNPSPFFKILYLIFLGYLFFLLRGDLLSGTAFLVGTVMAVSVPYILVAKFRKSLV